jgi:hypothetical protein
MTTGTGRDATWLRRWAAEQLSVPETANVAEARTALLRCLPECDFVPPPPWLRAVAILAGRQLPGAGGRAGEAAVWHEEAQRLRDEVEAFAEQFWTFSIAERRRQWEQLRSTCAGVPALNARLERLERGLDVRPAQPDGDGPLVVELVSGLPQLVVLRPAERANRRRALLRAAENDMAGWQSAAFRVQSWYPSIAELEPTLLAELALGGSRRQERARMVQDLFRPRRRVVENTAPAPEGPKLGYGWVVVVMLVLGVLRAGVGGLSRSTAPPKPDPPSRPALEGLLQWEPKPDPQWDHLRTTKQAETERLRKLIEEMHRKETGDSGERLRKLLEETKPRDREPSGVPPIPRSTGSGRP